MEWKEILAHVDHTLLNPAARWEEIRRIVDEGIQYGCASVCIPPAYVKQAAEYAAGRVPICTVIGFPNGYSTTAVKRAEARDAVANGAQEIDMVVNLGWVKDGLFDLVFGEIQAVKETCLLTREEKIRLCQIVGDSGADYIKTSTGFSTGGATFADVALLREYTPARVKVKAAGGISSQEDGERFLALGADRLGTSRLVKLAKEAGL